MRKILSIIVASCLILSGGGAAFSQTLPTGNQQALGAAQTMPGSFSGTIANKQGSNGVALPDQSAQTLLAMATEDYPATPGDVYTLVYLKVAQLDTISLVVEGDGSINAGFLGAFASRGLTFRQLKAQIEKKVVASYPGSNPSLIIASTGLFPVTVKGEVRQAGIATAWGLSRLSEVVAPFVGEYSSLREVSVISRDGKAASYDLFKARRSGDLSQDPYLKPGDIIELKRADRTVAIEGQVRRAGAYQLLAGEGVSELVAFYGDGALDGAKTDRALLTRKATAEKPEAESLVVDLGGKTFPVLADGDVLRVPSREEYLPIVSIEGAVAGAELGVKREALQGGAEAVETQQYRIIRIPYRQGAMLSEALRSIRGLIDPRADLKRAFIAKAGGLGQVEVDLEKLLYRYNPSDDIALAADDKVVIPYGSQYVFVTGEVAKSAWVGVTGLTRLSEAVKPLTTRFSSLRDVAVKSSDGAVARYDLFLAERRGDLTQDPYLRPGDMVEVGKADRIVTLEGEVRRPGSYQLLAGEGVAELVARYGDGAVEGAKTDLAVLTRKATTALPEGESRVFDLAGSPLPALGDGDLVRIPSREEYLPVVYVEGAVADAEVGVKQEALAGNANAVITEQYRILRLAYRQGQLLSQALRGIRERIDPRADLKRAFITRKGETGQIAVDLEKLLYNYDPSDDMALKADDKIVIPYGSMYVFVTGEVTKSAWTGITGLTRLSEAVKPLLTQYSSIRDLAVASEDGSRLVYDLFKAERRGDLSQDPYLRPGDVIEVKKASRIVSLEGEVRRPGKYQLLAGEGVSELVEGYGDGALESAKTDLSVVTRRATAGKPDSESLVFDLGAKSLPELSDGDRVRVPSREEYLPVIYIEGAVAGSELGVKQEAQAGNAGAVVTQQYRVMRLVYRQGQLLSQTLRGIREQIDARADLKRAFITRKGETAQIAVDLERLLYNYNPQDDVTLKADDKIVIPYGSMYAFVTGEVAKSAWVGITGLTRLSEAMKPLATRFSSIRDVKVTSEDGSESVYDLFAAEREGDLTQDPYLRPGDVIEVNKASRIVSLEGEVRRPGTYQLLASEGISELVKVYGDGALESAKTDLSVVTRRATAEKPDSESLVFDLGAKSLPELSDGDRVRVPSREEYLPIVYVEGAILSEAAQAAAKTPAAVNAAGATGPEKEPYSFIRVPVRQGQLLSQVVKPLEARISPDADISNAYVIRGTTRILVNIEKILHSYKASEDLKLEADDRIVFPFGRNFAFVKGEVLRALRVEVTSLTRLSEAVKGNLGAQSSTRDILVTSLDGLSKTYDLFRAERLGDASQDPYLRPGDIVEVRKAPMIVSLDGEVRRPGTYQLLSGEGVKELIAVYGDGLLESAKPDLSVLIRRATIDKPESESLVFDLSSSTPPLLVDGDRLRIPSREEYLPVVYVEGAVAGAEVGVKQEALAGNADAVVTQEYRVVRLPFRQGLVLSQAIRGMRDRIDPRADLKRAFITRKGETAPVAVNLDRLLYNYDSSDDMALKADDKIVIPYGSMYVFVTGEVTKSAWTGITGLTRLSEAVKPLLTQYSSIRDLAVASEDGSRLVYDLFKAERLGDLSQDPYLRPGDVIEVKKASRIVSLEGEVHRPGKYQLLASEGIADLVAAYGDGALDSAQTDLSMLTRRATLEKPESETVVFSLAENTLPELLDGDKVKVPSREEYLPIIYIEGAVAGDPIALSDLGKTVQQTSYAVLRLPYRKGMSLSTLLRPIKDKILSSANLTNAFIIREGDENQLVVNLERLLYKNDAGEDTLLEPGDKLVIPFGSMYVFISGEVTKSTWAGITGLTRLRDIVMPLLTRYSSVRDVKVISEDGTEKVYDLFKAERYGDLSQDPFLRPGEKILVSELSYMVTIQGEVKRPGSYQLLPDEGLAELLEVYALGFSEKANPSRLGLIRYQSDKDPVGEKIQFDYTKFPNLPLRLYDIVTVPSIQELLPVVWFEGAIGVTTAGASPETSQRAAYTYMPGETVAQAALANRKLFSAVSDISKAYLLRTDGSKLAVDLGRFIYNYELNGDVELKPGDTIIVPFRQFFVSVSGAVKSPGRYPYIPDRTWEYYVGLAGGFDTDRNANQKLMIYDANSNKVAFSGRVIQPEDNIEAASNSFLYGFGKVSAILTTILSVASLIIALIP